MNFFFFYILQYISGNPGVQGAYMPQYPPLQAAPVSLLYLIVSFNSSFKKFRLPGVHLTVIYLLPITKAGSYSFALFLKCPSSKTINYLSANTLKIVIITF